MAIGGLDPFFSGGIGAACVGMVLHIIGIATPSWSTTDAKKSSQQSGLFRRCNCGDMVEAEETTELKAVRAMVIIGVLIAAVAVVLLCLRVIFMAAGKPFFTKTFLIAAIACFLAAIFIFVGVIIYATEVHGAFYFRGSDLGFSFALSIVGAILLVVGGILLIMAGRAVG